MTDDASNSPSRIRRMRAASRRGMHHATLAIIALLMATILLISWLLLVKRVHSGMHELSITPELYVTIVRTTHLPNLTIFSDTRYGGESRGVPPDHHYAITHPLPGVQLWQGQAARFSRQHGHAWYWLEISLWYPIAGVMMLSLAMASWKAFKPTPPGLCRKCGYDLRYTTQDTCPECGRAIPPAQRTKMQPPSNPAQA